MPEGEKLYSKTLGVPVVIGGDNLPSPVVIGLTNLPNIGWGGGLWPPWLPVAGTTDKRPPSKLLFKR